MKTYCIKCNNEIVILKPTILKYKDNEIYIIGKDKKGHLVNRIIPVY